MPRARKAKAKKKYAVELKPGLARAEFFEGHPGEAKYQDLYGATVWYPRSFENEDDRVRVSIKTHGCELLLFFEDRNAEGPVLELRLLPDVAELEPKVLERLIPQAPLLAQYARALIRADADDYMAMGKALRDLGATRRGLGDDFYELISRNYVDLVAEGEPHPVKALAALHHVSVSAASRWLKEARRRNLIKEADDAS